MKKKTENSFPVCRGETKSLGAILYISWCIQLYGKQRFRGVHIRQVFGSGRVCQDTSNIPSVSVCVCVSVRVCLCCRPVYGGRLSIPFGFRVGTAVDAPIGVRHTGVFFFLFCTWYSTSKKYEVIFFLLRNCQCDITTADQQKGEAVKCMQRYLSTRILNKVAVVALLSLILANYHPAPAVPY